MNMEAVVVQTRKNVINVQLRGTRLGEGEMKNKKTSIKKLTLELSSDYLKTA